MSYYEELQFLKSVSLEQCIEKFREEEICLNLMTDLTDDNLKYLGIVNIGQKIKFRIAAKNWIGKSINETIVENTIVENTIVENTIPERSEHEEEGDRLIFFSRTLSSGQITHHLLDTFYRCDRNKAYTCSYRGCRVRYYFKLKNFV